MRRLFTLFVLLLLPLQFAFAAAAPYCALEKARIATHFGHHEHPDVSALDRADDGDDQGKVHDCSICHLGSGQVHPAVATIPAPPPVAKVVAIPDHRRPQHHQEPTERPPRISLA